MCEIRARHEALVPIIPVNGCVHVLAHWLRVYKMESDQKNLTNCSTQQIKNMYAAMSCYAATMCIDAGVTIPNNHCQDTITHVGSPVRMDMSLEWVHPRRTFHSMTPWLSHACPQNCRTLPGFTGVSMERIPYQGIGLATYRICYYVNPETIRGM